MISALDELHAQLARSAARELDKRLIWDMVCAYAEGTSIEEMTVALWPDGAKSVARAVPIGETVTLLGPKRRVRFDADQTSVRATVS